MDLAAIARRAFELVEQALELAGAEGRSPFLLLNRARSLENQGRISEAEADYREAEKLARGPKDALAATKAAIDLEAAMDLEAGLRHEAEEQAQLMLGPDYKEGYLAFTEKRDPKFP